MERETALCISESIMTDLGYTGEKSNFFSWLTNSDSRSRYGNDEWESIVVLYVEFDSLRDGISDSYQIIPAKKYMATERRIINVLQDQSCWDGRQILLGYSDTAIGWTDGRSYIAIDRNWLKRKSVTWGCDIAKIQMLLSHEMAHDNDSRGSHIHGPEFYENQVRYMERDCTAINYCASFKQAMETSRIVAKRNKEINKQVKARAKQDNKLGIAAKSS